MKSKLLLWKRSSCFQCLPNLPLEACTVFEIEYLKFYIINILGNLLYKTLFWCIILFNFYLKILSGEDLHIGTPHYLKISKNKIICFPIMQWKHCQLTVGLGLFYMQELFMTGINNCICMQILIDISKHLQSTYEYRWAQPSPSSLDYWLVPLVLV